ncbi:MAG: hypothetical protein COA78_09870 [Blastopirellula sp.]|nr:MAG: hypothetical protein COA78_09870 [Blastopirellula sp.]
MRPYFTVLIDSFHEALASRVLWILIVLSTLFLLLLAPIGISEDRATGFNRSNVTNWPSLIKKLRSQIDSDKPSPGKHIASLSGDEFTKLIKGIQFTDNQLEISRDLIPPIEKAIYTSLDREDFYDEQSWKEITLSKEVQELIKNSSKKSSKDDIKYRNRLLLKAAYRNELNLDSSTLETSISYLGIIETPSFAISSQMLDMAIRLILSTIMSVFVGAFAVFAGILVTAPIIPRTFEAGAIDLLLSKPVSRSLLFLTKFLGGCLFILLNASYFITGLWLILGLRLGIWHHQLLYCIPVFLFLFAIYYSVSAFAGVVWKNSIVCIVLSILFWGLCFSVGLSKVFLESNFLFPEQIVKIQKTNDSVVAVTQSGKILQWEDDLNEWSVAINPNSGRNRGPGGPPSKEIVIGPVYDKNKNELIFIQRTFRRGAFDFSGGGSELSIGTWAGNWQKNTGAKPPVGTSWIYLDDEGTLTTVSINGISQINSKNRAGGNGASILGFKLPFGGKTAYEPLGPEFVIGLIPPFSAAMDKESGDIVIYNRAKLHLLVRGPEGKYTEESSFHYEDTKGSTALAFGGQNILIAFSDGKVLQIDKNNLASGIGKEYHPAGKSEPYLAACSDDGQHFGILFHDGTMWTLDTQSKQTDYLSGDISGFTFADDEIWVADRINRITKYGLTDKNKNGEYNPNPDTVLTIYWYGIKPLHTIFPKPGELGNVVRYLIMEKETVALGPGTNELRTSRESMDIWSPIINSTIFIVIMLGITCIYIERNDM